MNDQPRGNWSSNIGLVLAATGSAIGLGNLWKFPFITWENNGGAFVLVYLVCIAGVGLPIMLAELLIGRRSQKSVVGALREAAGPAWGVAGGWGVLCGFILLSYYTVIAGWSLFYFWKSAGWTLGGFPADLVAGDLFNEQVGTAGLQFILSLLFSATTIGIVYFGVQTGIERVARFSLPVLFGILVLLLVSTLGMSGSGQALRFIFVPRFAELEWEGVLEALGHAFFTLSVGMGTMITYGSYISRTHSIVKAAGAIVILDTLIALLATIIMFSVIFSVAGLSEQVSGSTVGMLFISLPRVVLHRGPVRRGAGTAVLRPGGAGRAHLHHLAPGDGGQLPDRRAGTEPPAGGGHGGRGDLRLHHLRGALVRLDPDPLDHDRLRKAGLVQHRRPYRVELDAPHRRPGHRDRGGVVHDAQRLAGGTRRRQRAGLVSV